MTTADTLRKAAGVITRRAVPAATDGMRPYGRDGEPLPVDQWAALYGDDYLGGVGGEHVALWSPPVALAVAAWLEAEAAMLDALEPTTAIANVTLRHFTGARTVIELAHTESGEVLMQASTTESALLLAALILSTEEESG